MVKGRLVKLQLWDTAGQERFSVVTGNYYRNSDGFVFVYDSTNRDSFDHVETFNTLISCKQCLGLDAPATADTGATVAALSASVKGLSDGMSHLLSAVDSLNEKVGGNASVTQEMVKASIDAAHAQISGIPAVGNLTTPATSNPQAQNVTTAANNSNESALLVHRSQAPVTHSKVLRKVARAAPQKLARGLHHHVLRATAARRHARKLAEQEEEENEEAELGVEI